MANKRSMHSVAKLTAVSKPKVASVCSRSLSIVFGTPITRSPASDRWLPMVSEPSPPMVMSASMPCCSNSANSSGVRSTSTQLPSGCCTGYAVGLPRLVVPMMVPPWWTMPRTRSRVSWMSPPSGYSSGRNKPLKPSRMPTTSHPRLMAARVADRITALRPGASPPPVDRAMRRMGCFMYPTVASRYHGGPSTYAVMAVGPLIRQNSLPSGSAIT